MKQDFKIVLAEPKYLRESINVVSNLINDAKVLVTQDKLTIIEMDPANVCMVCFELLSSACVEFQAIETKFNINIMNLKTILKNAKESDLIEIIKEENNLIITLKGKSIRKYEIKLPEEEQSSTTMPNLDFKTTVIMPSHILQDQIKEMHTIGISAIFESKKNLFELLTKDDSIKLTIPNKEEDNISIICVEESKTRYSLDYLNIIAESKKVAPIVKLGFSNNYPLKVEYELTDKLSLKWILAPRIKNE